MTAGDNPERAGGESAFASLCGASPVEAPGGKVKRHRLNRGGDRQANRALHTIARQRMKRDSRTKLYVDKRTKEGKSRREIERILVRYIAREVYGALMRPMDAALRALQGVGEGGQVGAPEGRGRAGPGLRALGVASARISEMERGRLVDAPLLQRLPELA